jgi:hypothetical protein
MHSIKNILERNKIDTQSRAGLALENPPKKTQKNPPKKTH